MSRTVPKRHTHSASEILGGVLPAAAIPPGLFAPVSHDHPPSDITGLDDYLSSVVGGLLVEGPGIDLTQDSITGAITIEATGGGGGGVAVRDEGVTLTGAAGFLDFVGGGVAASTVSGGVQISVPGAAFAGALVEKTSDQSITSSGALVSWNAASYDTNSIWSSGSPTRLTVPAGFSRVRLAACLRTSANNQNCTGHLVKNGSDIFVGNPTSYSYSATGGVMLISPVLAVSAGDYFEAFWWPPGTYDLIGGSGRRSWFAMELLP